jgi:hypothetical protein
MNQPRPPESDDDNEALGKAVLLLEFGSLVFSETLLFRTLEITTGQIVESTACRHRFDVDF